MPSLTKKRCLRIACKQVREILTSHIEFHIKMAGPTTNQNSVKKERKPRSTNFSAAESNVLVVFILRWYDALFGDYESLPGLGKTRYHKKWDELVREVNS